MDINFYCKPSKVDKKGLAPIVVVIIINGKRVQVATQYKMKPEQFKADVESRKSNDTKVIIDTLRAKLLNYANELSIRNIPLTADALKEYFKNGGVSKAYTLQELFHDFLLFQRDKLAIGDITDDTYHRYERTTKMFVEANSLNLEMPARDITLNHFKTYKVWLANTLDPATYGNYLQKIKACFKFAFEGGKIPSHPAANFKFEKGAKDTILYLKPNELDRIRKKEMPTERLQRVKDCFIFACYTGLAFSDLKELVKEDFQLDENGMYFIEKSRKKTGVKFCAVLTNDSLEIAKKYNFSIPVLSDQKYNSYLKEIQDLCSIPIKLTTHVARHTCAVYLINHRNPTIPNETIRKVMGWKDDRQMRHYAKLLNTTVLMDMKELQIAELSKVFDEILTSE